MLLPQCYPNYKTVHRRSRRGATMKLLRRILTDIANEQRATDALDEEKCMCTSGAQAGSDVPGSRYGFVDEHGHAMAASAIRSSGAIASMPCKPRSAPNAVVSASRP
jgi:hypothetical protein